MGRSARYLTFDGQFESSVLDTFRIIRGFANLKDLAEVSVPYTMVDDDSGGPVKGQQRQLDPQHAERIKRYLESGEQRFLPEVVLSVRTELTEELDRMRKPIGVCGHSVMLTYAPVGALRDKIYAGEPADLTIVTPVIIEQLLARGLVRSGTRTDLGRVGGGIAVRKGAPRPAIATPEELKQALLAAKEIYHADPKIATAGAYFLQVADRLGIGEEVRKKGRTAGGGKVSMELMARSTVEVIGLTQISEILSVPEVELVGPYPGDLQLMTTYTGILLQRTANPAAAEAFLRFLTSSTVQARFRLQGYDVPVR